MQQNRSNQPIDKGFIKAIVSQYPKKENGQPVLKQGTNEPVMANKYATIGEVTRWPSDNGGFYDAIEFYPGFTILDSNKNARLFWESQRQQTR